MSKSKGALPSICSSAAEYLTFEAGQLAQLSGNSGLLPLS
jgi:hypothetical protein